MILPEARFPAPINCATLYEADIRLCAIAGGRGLDSIPEAATPRPYMPMVLFVSERAYYSRRLMALRVREIFWMRSDSATTARFQRRRPRWRARLSDSAPDAATCDSDG